MITKVEAASGLRRGPGPCWSELDFRPGGANLVVMRDPEGNAFPNQGIYLEVVENERLVLTDAYTKA
jgi:uncharacterized protein YndB with AHSA1/START domain